MRGSQILLITAVDKVKSNGRKCTKMKITLFSLLHYSLRIFPFFPRSTKKIHFPFSYGSSYLLILSQIFITINVYSPSYWIIFLLLSWGIESSSFSYVSEISWIIRLLLMIIFVEGGITSKGSGLVHVIRVYCTTTIVAVCIQKRNEKWEDLKDWTRTRGGQRKRKRKKKEEKGEKKEEDEEKKGERHDGDVARRSGVLLRQHLNRIVAAPAVVTVYINTYICVIYINCVFVFYIID